MGEFVERGFSGNARTIPMPPIWRFVQSSARQSSATEGPPLSGERKPGQSGKPGHSKYRQLSESCLPVDRLPAGLSAVRLHRSPVGAAGERNPTETERVRPLWAHPDGSFSLATPTYPVLVSLTRQPFRAPLRASDTRSAWRPCGRNPDVLRLSGPTKRVGWNRWAISAPVTRKGVD